MRYPTTFISASILALASAHCGDDAATDRDTQTPSDTSQTSPDGSDATSSDDTSVEPDSDATTTTPGDTSEPGDTTTPTDTTTEPDGDTHEPPPVLAVDRYGTRLYGAILGVSRVGRQLWIGTRANPDYMDPTETPPMLGGLVRLDLDTGRTTTFTDELGLEDYAFAGYDGLFGPTATAGVQADGDRIVVVAHTGLLAIEDDLVTPFEVRLPDDGPAVIPINLAIARDGLRPVAWLTSDQGLLRLDEDTYEVEDIVTAADAGATAGDYGKLTVDPDTGTVFASFFPTDNSATRIVSVTVTGEIHVLVPGTNNTPTGRVGDLVWSAADQRAYIALAAWNAAQGGVISWDGKDPATPGSAQTLAREGAIANGNPFGAQILALDDEHHVLAVGAQVLGNPIASPKGGGLAWIHLSTGPEDPVRIVSTLTKGIETPFVTIHAQAMTFDPETGRLYIALSDICSETRLRSRGVFALSFDEKGTLRFERPLLSSVRSIGVLDEHLWIGMRDDNGGLACLGYPITTGFARVTEGGVGELNLMHPIGEDLIVKDPNVTAIGGTSEGDFVLGTFRDGFYVGSLGAGVVGNPAFLGPSLLTTDLLWNTEKRELWLAGGTTHNPGDWDILADRGPRGAAVVEIGEGPSIGHVTKFVRAADPLTDEVIGLPSGEIMDLLWGPDGSVYMACATETVKASDWDRSVQPDFVFADEKRLGGVASVSADRKITVVADSTVAPDARAIAWDADERLLVADAEKGLLRLDEDGPTVIPTPGLPADAIPQTLWSSPRGDLALGTSKGLYLEWHGAKKVLDDVGFVWAIAEQGDYLYVGTDVGLVVIRAATTPAAPLPERSPAGLVPFPAGD